MYFSNASYSTNLSIYKTLLDKYLEEKKDVKVKELFEKIILTTHLLIKGEIQESNIDHTIYSLVILLNDFKKEYTRNYFLNINPQQIDLNNFRTLSSILSSLVVAGNNPD